MVILVVVFAVSGANVSCSLVCGPTGLGGPPWRAGTHALDRMRCAHHPYPRFVIRRVCPCVCPCVCVRACVCVLGGEARDIRHI